MIKVPRGTEDVLPEKVKTWHYIENKLHKIADTFNYKEIRTPIFERTELFLRGVGETTDIVQKEMYTFEDRGGRSLTLRPEGTASVVRSYVENKMHGLPNQPVKLYYMGPIFRYERPQKGRNRQFTQFGIEALGSADPAIDAEVIAFAMQCYESMGLSSLRLVINSLGDLESRKNHRQALIDHFTPHKGELCEDCQTRLEQNPLRVLDCKKDREHPAMGTAPSILEYLNEESRKYFEDVKDYLETMGISYEIDPTMVRGLDYYNHTVFEIMSDAEGFGAITTLTGGGRYNGLVQELGGPETPGIGFAFSIERLIMALEAEGIQLPLEDKLDCFVVAMGDQARKEAARIVYNLRKAGLKADKDYMDKKIKAQFKAADRFHSKFVLVLGEDELSEGKISVKNMATGDQEKKSLDEILTYLKEMMQGGQHHG
ncbi:MAG: histidine--tRNA ligase [Bacillaceae bacterium]|nr:histidine--tRNA ligase [Bacillaceae bacterium]